MNKRQYLESLREELKANNIEDIEEIIADYEEHFDCKADEGFTEEETAQKLSAPKEIAKEYCESNVPVNKFEKGMKTTGIFFMSLPLSLLYALMWCSAIVLTAFSVVCAVTGFCLITTVNIANLIPYMPYLCALFIGISCFGLAVLSAIGAFYLALFYIQWGKVYLNWCKNTINGNQRPSLSKYPKISKKLAAKIKLTAVIGLACFATAFIIGFVSLCLYAHSFAPWHVWDWFVYGK